MRRDQRLELILKKSAKVFAELGYDRASIRDISRETRLSLAGLYYYFRSKGDLLYLLQRHCFETLLERLEQGLARIDSPEEKIRFVVKTHVEYFAENIDEMKVMSHEGKSLTGKYRREIHEYKRTYYRLLEELMEDLGRHRGVRPVRIRWAVMALFGMINWIYTWYRPTVDGPASGLADEIATLFLQGILDGAAEPRARRVSREARREKPLSRAGRGA